MERKAGVISLTKVRAEILELIYVGSSSFQTRPEPNPDVRFQISKLSVCGDAHYDLASSNTLFISGPCSSSSVLAKEWSQPLP